jgi:hypothetical protein
MRLACFIVVCAAGALCGAASTLASPSGGAPATAPARQAKLPPFNPIALIDQLAAARDQDPLGYLVIDMDELTSLLDRLNTRTPVQPKQARVVAHLDRLIEILEKQCKGSGGANPNPTKPMADSVIAKGPGGAGPLHDPQQGTRNWAQLSPKQREQILQSQTEGFPPGFESILSSYYKRLAQESVVADTAAAPATQPTSP